MKAREGLLIRGCDDRTRSNGFQLEDGRLKLNTRKKFFIVRVVKYWHRLSRGVVYSLSLETLEIRLDETLSNLVE